MTYQIFSDVPCVAKIDNESFELDETNVLELSEFSTTYLYPLIKGHLPTIIKENFDNASTIKDSGVTYIFPEFLTVSSGEIFLSKTFGNKLALLTGLPYKFTISSDDSSKSYSIKKNISSPEIISLSGDPCVSANFKDKSYLLIYTEDSFIELCGDIDINKNAVQSIENLESLSGHGKLTRLEINLGKAKILEDELLYLNEKPIKPKFIGAKNYAFLQSIMLKDYDLARSYLDENLSKKLSNEHFLKFFQEFDEILAISTEKFCLKNKNTPIGVFTLKNVNGKIVDVN